MLITAAILIQYGHKRYASQKLLTKNKKVAIKVYSESCCVPCLKPAVVVTFYVRLIEMIQYFLGQYMRISD